MFNLCSAWQGAHCCAVDFSGSGHAAISGNISMWIGDLMCPFPRKENERPAFVSDFLSKWKDSLVRWQNLILKLIENKTTECMSWNFSRKWVLCKYQTSLRNSTEQIITFLRNRVARADFLRECLQTTKAKTRSLSVDSGENMANPVKLFKRPKSRPASYAAPDGSGTLIRPEKDAKDKDIPLSTLCPPSPTMDQQRTFRKFSHFSIRSDTSDQNECDNNSNTVGSKTHSKHHQVCGTGNPGFTQLCDLILLNCACKIVDTEVYGKHFMTNSQRC